MTPKPKTVKVSELGGSWLPISLFESKFNVDSHLESKFNVDTVDSHLDSRPRP